jgi:hypothetical protein
MLKKFLLARAKIFFIKKISYWRNYQYYHKLIMKKRKKMKNNISIKHCIICDKQTQSKCKKCNIVYYCGRECEKMDSDEHKKICRKTLPEFLNAIVKQHIEPCSSCLYTCDVQICLNGHGHNTFTNPHYEIPHYGIRHILDTYFCVICGEDIIDIKIGKKLFSSIKNNYMGYYRCKICYNMGYHLCHETLKFNQKCFKLNIITFILCLKKNFQWINRDIINCVLKKCIEIKCCF